MFTQEVFTFEYDERFMSTNEQKDMLINPLIFVYFYSFFCTIAMFLTKIL